MTDQALPASSPNAIEQEISALRRRIAELEARQAAHTSATETGFLQAALDALPAHIAVLDHAGTIVMVNTAWRQFADENELPAASNYGLGSNYLAVCEHATGPFSEDAPLAADGIRAVMERRSDVFRHTYTCHSPEERRWFAMQVNPLASVTPPHTLVAHMNVSAYQMTHIALEENRHTLETLLSNLPGMAYRYQNDPDWTMLFVSEGCTNLTGYSPDHLLSNKDVLYRDLIHPDDVQHVWDTVQNSIARDQPFQIIYRIIPKHGTEKWVWEQGRAVLLADGTTVLEGLIIDFTPQKQAQLALQASEQKLRSLIDQSNDGIVLADSAGLIVEWNQAMERITGQPHDKAVGRPMWEIQYDLLPESRRQGIDPQQLAASVAQVIANTGGLEISDENPIQRPDGAIRTLQTSPFPIRTDRGQFFGAIVRDVTEQHAAANALRESEERWRSLVQHAPDLIYMIDRDGMLLFVNYTVAGFSVDDTLRRTIYDFAPPAYSEALRQAVTQAFELQQPVDLELESPVSGGGMGWYSTRIGPIIRDGEVVAAILIAHDITQRSQHEAELRASEERYRSLFEEVPVSLWEEDFSRVKTEIERLRAGGVTNFEQYLTERPHEVSRLMALTRIININQATLDMVHARTKADVLDNLKIAPLPEIVPLLRAQLIAIANGQTSFAGIGYGMRRNSGSFPVSLKWVALGGYEESLAQIIVSMEDISARQEAESHRLRTAIEHEKVTILADFVQNASHEFRTPLSVIFTGLELIERRAHLDEDWQHRLIAMKNQTQYLSELVESMLTMAQLDRTTELSGMLLDLNPIVRDVALEAKRQAQDRQIVLDINLPEHLPRIYGDASALRRALLNITKNAVQFSPAGGTITLSIDQHEHEIAINISDQGIGIAPEHLPYVFDRFYRVDRARRSRFAGMGLSISRKIVDLHGGRIAVTSTPDQGSTFTVWLPLITPASQS